MQNIIEFLAKKHQNSSSEYNFPVYTLWNTLTAEKYLILDITKEDAQSFISEMFDTINFDTAYTSTSPKDMFNDVYEEINKQHINQWYIGLYIRNRQGKLSLIGNGLLKAPGLIFQNVVYTVEKYIKGSWQRKRYSYSKTNNTVHNIDDFKKYCMVCS